MSQYVHQVERQGVEGLHELAAIQAVDDELRESFPEVERIHAVSGLMEIFSAIIAHCKWTIFGSERPLPLRRHFLITCELWWR